MANDEILEPSDLQEPAGSNPFFAAASQFADRSSGEAVLEVYIDNAADQQQLAQGSTVQTLESSATEQAFINGTLNYIDQWIDLDLRERLDPYGSYLDIYKVDHVDGIINNVAGEVQLVLPGPTIELQWEDEGNPDQLSFWEKRVITHELAHVFGLTHPNGDGPNPNFDSADTSLSYNNYASDWAYKLTAMDVLAMVELWGLENDPSGLNQSGDASDEQFTVLISGAASDEFGNVLRIDAGAGDDTFISDIRGTLAGQSGAILRGGIGSDLSRFLLPDPDSNNPLLWLDLYSSAALSLSIVQTTRSDGAYTITITDSEQLEFKFTGNGTAQTLSFNGGTSYGRMGYGELISRAIPITAAIIPVVPAPTPPVASGGGGGGGGGGSAPATPVAPSASDPVIIAVTPASAQAPPPLNGSTGQSDPLIGDSANNTLIAGSGRTVLEGGAGADIFAFRTPERFTAATADQITDFNPSEGDRISLAPESFAGLQQIRFRVAASPRRLERLGRTIQNVIYSVADQGLYYDANGTRDGFGRDGGLFAVLTNGVRPNASSFIIEQGA